MLSVCPTMCEPSVMRVPSSVTLTLVRLRRLMPFFHMGRADSLYIMASPVLMVPFFWVAALTTPTYLPLGDTADSMMILPLLFRLMRYICFRESAIVIESRRTLTR